MFRYQMNEDSTPKMSQFRICHQWNASNSVNKCHSKSQLSVKKTSCKSDFEYGPKNRFKRFTARRAFQNVCPQIKWKGGDEWYATAGVSQQMILSSFSDYANLSFWDEPTWMQRNMLSDARENVEFSAKVLNASTYPLSVEDDLPIDEFLFVQRSFNPLEIAACLIC